ncbi:acyltransferase family protein [Agromyces atrinae]|uniref:Putative membrane protein YcfT n=1 Tax=Agromyces atrinae TaxID=592376 RepID=A0A852S534_9MICO|nr:acyltransferase family protein [Agromyces atrinae]NYD68418.1 putative membrane protein YcfT [Agromyces atrinae]
MAETARRASRLDWVDTGRGTAILLVVLFHSINWLLEAGFDVAGWQTASAFIASLRLPLFFMLAGLFAQKWLTAPWPKLWSTKLSLYVWVYALWSVIATFTFMLGLNLQGQEGNYLYQLVYLVAAPVSPRFELWFIWALALFFAGAKLIRRVPPWIQLSLAAILSIVAMSIEGFGGIGWGGAAKYAFFFLVGLYLRDRIMTYATSTRWALLGVACAVWAAVAAAGTFGGLATSVPGYYFLTCCLGLLAGICLSRVLSPVRFLRRIGSRTLPIYLTHTSIILIVCWLLHFLAEPVKENLLVAVLAPPLLAAGSAWLSLVIANRVERSPVLRYAYVQPAWLSRSKSVDSR